MNLLMMTIYYPDECYQEVASLSKDGMQNQINNYQKAFVEGINACLEPSEKLQILNSLPVGIFPVQYGKLFIPKATYEEGRVWETGCVNLPCIKQKMREKRAARLLLRWLKAHSDNRRVLVYTQYLPYLKAILKAKRKYPDLKVAVIVTDLPNQYGLDSGRSGLLKRIEQRMGEKQLELLQQIDGFVLLTEHMAEVLPCEDKKTMVIEGLIQQREDAKSDVINEKESDSFEVLYTGTLSPELGIQEMLDAFAAMPEIRLRICGGGIMAEQVRAFADQHENIVFEGFVPQEKALALQAKANALINPRTPAGKFTRYSFPSKTLEYMRSGKSVLCYRLDGIPAEYDEYLNYIPSQDAAGIQQAVRSLMQLSAEERQQMGERAKAFVMTHKNPKAQCHKLVSWLRSL